MRMLVVRAQAFQLRPVVSIRLRVADLSGTLGYLHLFLKVVSCTLVRLYEQLVFAVGGNTLMTPQTGNNSVVLGGVTVVDALDGLLSANRDASSEGGHITSIAAARTDSAGRVDLTGRFLVPGYLDMDVHAPNSTAPEGALALVLTVRHHRVSPDESQRQATRGSKVRGARASGSVALGCVVAPA